MVPALAPSFLIAGLFAFLASMDNYPVSIFLTDVAHQDAADPDAAIYRGSARSDARGALHPDPAGTVILLFVSDRVVGLHRMAGTGGLNGMTRTEAIRLAARLRRLSRRAADPRWPGRRARRGVASCVNFEEGAEFSVSDGDAGNEAIYEVEHRLDGPDPCIDSHFEYGTRAGMVARSWICSTPTASRRRSAPAAARSSARRQLARDAIARGHEVSAHGWRWESHAGMERGDASARRIARTVAAIARRHRAAPGRLAHPLGVLAQHAPAAGRGRRLPLRQRRL